MKVILLQNINNVGAKGEVKSVSDGFAGNYLFPQKLAVPATEQAILKLQSQSFKKENQLARQKTELSSLAGKLDGREIIITAKASDKGTLYKSISAKDISLEIKRQLGYNVGEKCILLEQPIKIAGEFKVKARAGEKDSELLVKIRELNG